MKQALIFSLLSLFFLSCSSVDLLNQPLDVNDGSDPLASPLSNLKSNKKERSSSSNAYNYTPGTWVETAMPDADFHNKYPLFSKKTNRNLPVATAAKIISYRGSYAKVELETGDVGYIPSIMLIEKGDESDDYYPEKPKSTKRIPIVSSADPAPPTEDEILAKIKAREQQSPTIEIPTAPATDDFVAPEPEIQGVRPPTSSGNNSTSISPPPTPTIPETPSINTAPQPIVAPAPEPIVAPKLDPIPPTPEIKINKPVETSKPSSITAPSGDKINQDAALELRITEPY